MVILSEDELSKVKWDEPAPEPTKAMRPLATNELSGVQWDDAPKPEPGYFAAPDTTLGKIERFGDKSMPLVGSDTGRALRGGIMEMGAGLATLPAVGLHYAQKGIEAVSPTVGAVTEKVTKPVTETLLAGRQKALDVKEGILEGMSPEAKAEYGKPLFTPESTWDPRTWTVNPEATFGTVYYSMVENLPQLAGGIGPIRKVAMTVGAKAVEKAVASGMAKEAAEALGHTAIDRATKAASAVYGAALSGGMNASQAYGEIRQIPIEDLAKSPKYQDLVRNGATPEQAREAMAQDAMAYAGAASAPLGAISGFFNLGLPLTTTGKFLSRVAKGALINIPEEAITEGLEQIVTNMGVKQAGIEGKDVYEGLADSMVLGGLIGGMFGGVGGAFGPAGSAAEGQVKTPSGAVALEAASATPGKVSATPEEAAKIKAVGKDVAEAAQTAQDQAIKQGAAVDIMSGAPVIGELEAEALSETPADSVKGRALLADMAEGRKPEVVKKAAQALSITPEEVVRQAHDTLNGKVHAPMAEFVGGHVALEATQKAKGKQAEPIPEIIPGKQAEVAPPKDILSGEPTVRRGETPGVIISATPAAQQAGPTVAEAPITEGPEAQAAPATAIPSGGKESNISELPQGVSPTPSGPTQVLSDTETLPPSAPVTGIPATPAAQETPSQAGQRMAVELGPGELVAQGLRKVEVKGVEAGAPAVAAYERPVLSAMLKDHGTAAWASPEATGATHAQHKAAIQAAIRGKVTVEQKQVLDRLYDGAYPQYKGATPQAAGAPAPTQQAAIAPGLAPQAFSAREGVAQAAPTAPSETALKSEEAVKGPGPLTKKLGMYSAVEATLVGKMDAKGALKSGTPSKWLAEILKGEFVTKAEVEWMGLETRLEALAGGKGKSVTRAQVLGVVRENIVPLKEVVLSGDTLVIDITPWREPNTRNMFQPGENSRAMVFEEVSVEYSGDRRARDIYILGTSLPDERGWLRYNALLADPEGDVPAIRLRGAVEREGATPTQILNELVKNAWTYGRSFKVFNQKVTDDDAIQLNHNELYIEHRRDEQEPYLVYRSKEEADDNIRYATGKAGPKAVKYGEHVQPGKYEYYGEIIFDLDTALLVIHGTERHWRGTAAKKAQMHVRYTIRKDKATGKRVLHIEEMQADAVQEQRSTEEATGEPLPKSATQSFVEHKAARELKKAENDLELKKLREDLETHNLNNIYLGELLSGARPIPPGSSLRDIIEKRNHLAAMREEAKYRISVLEKESLGVEPLISSPFISNWAEVAMRRMFILAAEQGIDMVSVVSPEEVIEMWKGALKKTVESIEYTAVREDGEVRYRVKLFERKHDLGSGMFVPGLSDKESVSKAEIDKILWSGFSDNFKETSGTHRVHTGRIEWTAKWPQEIYGKRAMAFFKKFATKYGAKPETVIFPGTSVVREAIPMTDRMRDELLNKGLPLYQIKEKGKALPTAKANKNIHAALYKAFPYAERVEAVSEAKSEALLAKAAWANSDMIDNIAREGHEGYEGGTKFQKPAEALGGRIVAIVHLPKNRLLYVFDNAALVLDEQAKRTGRAKGVQDPQAYGAFAGSNKMGVIWLAGISDDETIFHEAWHFVKAALTTADENATLYKYFKGKEEIEADAFAKFLKGIHSPKEIESIFQRIKAWAQNYLKYVYANVQVWLGNPEEQRAGAQSLKAQRYDRLLQILIAKPEVARVFKTAASGQTMAKRTGRAMRQDNLKGGKKYSARGLSPEVQSKVPGVQDQIDKNYGISTGTYLEKASAFIKNTFAVFTKQFYRLDYKKYPKVVDILRRLREVPTDAKRRAIEDLRLVTEGLNKDEMQVFTMNLLLDDISKDIEMQVLTPNDPMLQRDWLPFGYKTEEQVALDLEHFQALKAKMPKVQDALAKRKKIMGNLTKELVSLGILHKSVLNDDRYFHHQVLAYWGQDRKSLGIGASVGEKLELRKKGWQKMRKGTAEGYNTNYLEAEFTTLAQMYAVAEYKKGIAEIKQETDIYSQLKRQAENWNEAEAAKIIAPEELKGYKAMIAKGIRGLEDQAKQNLLPAGAYQDVVDKIKAKTIDLGDRRFWAYLNELIASDGYGKADALSIYKALAERRKRVREVLGERRRTFNDYMAEDMVAWNPDTKGRWFEVHTIPQHIVQNVLDNGMSEVYGDEIRSAFTKANAIPWVIPKEMAETLDQYNEFKKEGPLTIAADRINSGWKQWILLNPLNVIAYNLNNLSGDVDIAFAYAPEIISKYAKDAGRDLVAYWRGTASPAVRAEIDAAYRDAVLGSSITAEEVPDINESVLYDMLVDTGRMGAITTRVRKAAKVTRELTTLRENLLRLSAYRYFMAEAKAGRVHYAASNQAEINALMDAAKGDAKWRDRLAAKLARELMGDYGAISEAGQWIRRRLIPFYSWLEINFPRYVRLFRNAAATDQGARAAIKKTSFIAVKAMAFYAIVAIWNSMHPDEEDDLKDIEKRQLHLILGRREDGSVITVKLQGALSDALSWFGAEDFPQDYKDIVSGRVPVGEKIKDMFKAPLQRLWGGARPIEKGIGEAIIGKTTYPDMFNARPIRDRVEHLLGVFNFDMPYNRLLTDKPNRDIMDDLIRMFGVRTTDAGEASYFNSMKLVNDWMDSEGLQRTASEPTSKANAAYYYKKALQWGDVAAAKDMLEKYYEMGGTRKTMKQSIKAGAPMSQLKVKDRMRFLKSLTPKDRETITQAQDWYKNLYLKDREAQTQRITGE